MSGEGLLIIALLSAILINVADDDAWVLVGLLGVVASLTMGVGWLIYILALTI